jgi:hypothetical protein
LRKNYISGISESKDFGYTFIQPWRDTMKKIAILMAVLAMLGTNAAHAQNTTGKGSAAGSSAGTNNGMAWIVGLGSLGVLGTVVGITAASASSSPNTFSH